MLNHKKLQAVAEFLIARNETLAVAESVTAGLLTAGLSLSTNATSFLQGGLIAYNLGQKTKQLGIEPIHAERVNCVSEAVAREMARSVSERFCSQWGIGVTGYAVPVPALKIRKCYAIFSFSFNGQAAYTARVETALKGQANVQQYFVTNIVDSFLDHVEKFRQ